MKKISTVQTFLVVLLFWMKRAMGIENSPTLLSPEI